MTNKNKVSPINSQCEHILCFVGPETGQVAHGARMAYILRRNMKHSLKFAWRKAQHADS